MSYKDDRSKKNNSKSKNSTLVSYSPTKENNKTNKNLKLLNGMKHIQNKNNNNFLESNNNNSTKSKFYCPKNKNKISNNKSKDTIKNDKKQNKNKSDKSAIDNNDNNKKNFKYTNDYINDNSKKKKKEIEEEKKKKKEIEEEKKKKKEIEEEKKKQKEIEEEKKKQKEIEDEKRKKELLEKERLKKEKDEREKEEEKKREEERKRRKKEETKIEKKEEEKKREEKEKIVENDLTKLSSISIDSDVYKIITSKTGLRNIGNTCFMNTCLQNLIHSEYFIEELLSKKNLITDNTPISKAFYKLCNNLITYENSSSFSPYELKNEIGYKHSSFSGFNQHDTQEFCRVFLEDMNKELNEVKTPKPYKELDTKDKKKEICDKEFDKFFRGRENSLIIDVFYGQLVNIFKCKCGKETYSFEKILDFPLLLEKESSSCKIKDLLDKYFEEENIEFETKCENCDKKVVHSKKVKISSLPNILILSLQRIDRRGNKIKSDVSFPDELDLSTYIDTDCCKDDDIKYTLYAIGNHSGSINFGHYYAYIKINKEKWYEYNDSSVTSYPICSGSSSTAYVLFYKKNKKIKNN